MIDHPKRKLIVAVKCHLLTGGMRGSNQCCPCHVGQCKLDEHEQGEMEKHPRVVERKKSNLETQFIIVENPDGRNRN